MNDEKVVTDKKKILLYMSYRNWMSGAIMSLGEKYIKDGSYLTIEEDKDSISIRINNQRFRIEKGDFTEGFRKSD